MSETDRQTKIIFDSSGFSVEGGGGGGGGGTLISASAVAHSGVTITAECHVPAGSSHKHSLFPQLMIMI